MRVIYRGEAKCPCLQKLEEWYSQDPFRIEDEAEVECDCGRRWIFNLKLDGSGWYWYDPTDPIAIG